jgi:hypothetical protein
MKYISAWLPERDKNGQQPGHLGLSQSCNRRVPLTLRRYEKAPRRWRRGQQGYPALPLKLGKQRVIIGLAVHDHGLDHASQMSSFPPQAFGFVGAVTDVLKGPQQTREVRHQAERAMAVHPPVTVTFTPSRFLGHSPQARWEDPWRFLLRVPDRAPCPVHHRIATDHLT